MECSKNGTSALKQQTPELELELECLHQCVRCGVLYPCKEGPDRCQRAFYNGKCLLC